MTVLDDILAGVREDLVDRQAEVSLEALQAQAAARPSALPAESVLREGDAVKVIAEVKRSSPSKGALAAIADPAALASRLRVRRRAASSACSPRSAGSAAASPTSPPSGPRSTSRCCARTSSSRATRCGRPGRTAPTSSCSSSRRSSRRRSSRSSSASTRSGMTALVEVHDAEEVAPGGRRRRPGHRRQLPRPAHPRGRPADTSPGSRPSIPDGIVRIAESGVRGPHDVLDFARAGARRRPRRREPRDRRGPALRGRRPRRRGRPPRPAGGAQVSAPTDVPAGAATDAEPLSAHRGPYFGRFGGRFVPEALVAALDELDRGVRRGDGRPGVPRRAGPPAPHLHRPAEHPHRGAAVRRARRGRAGPAQARGPQPHRLAQDQQRPRPGAAHRSGWARPGSSPRPAPASTASPPRPPRRSSASSASSTWARRTPAGRRSTSPGCGCSAPRSSR